MYKVETKVLKDCKKGLKDTSDALGVSFKGGKLKLSHVNKLLENNTKLIKLLEDNYYV